MSLRPVYEMRPHEILEARERSGCAFVPVSPCWEWHSFHLPIGTDAVISESICRLMAERVGGIYFSPLSFGLDSYRTDEDLVKWGYQKGERIFGMNMPELPLASEYCDKEEMIKSVENRLNMLRASRFPIVFIVNNHAGKGQMDTLDEVAKKWDGPSFRVDFVRTRRFLTMTDKLPRVGGHAGFSETLLAAAFRPELIDLTKVPRERLTVRHAGILHNRPEIEPEWSPAAISLSLAQEFRENIINNFAQYIRDTYGIPQG